MRRLPAVPLALFLSSSIGPRHPLLIPPHSYNYCVRRPSMSVSMSTTTTTSNTSGGGGGGGGGAYTYRYPRPSVTVDTLIFSADPKEKDDGVSLLLIKRANPPFQGSYALPGGFVDPDEDLDDAAARELKEETGLDGVALAQVGAFGKPGRDPRGHTITVAFTAFCLLSRAQREAAVHAGDDAAEAGWFPLARLPPLAFDHAEVIRATWRRVECAAVGEGGRLVVRERGSGRELLQVVGGQEEGKRVAALMEGTEPGFAS